jgi:hypothetical protein
MGHNEMRKRRLSILPLLLTLSILAAPIVASAEVVVGTVNDGNADPFGFWNNTGAYQQVYSASAFSGAIDISSLTFYLYSDPRGGNGSALQPGPYSIYLSTTAAAVKGLSSTLANNIGADETLVYLGSPPGETTVGSQGTYTFSLSTDFLYNPAAGNLLLTVTNQTPGSPISLETYLEADDSGSLTSRGLNNNGLNNSQALLDNVGLVTGFNVSPVPLPAALWLLVSGICGVGVLARARQRNQSRLA